MCHKWGGLKQQKCIPSRCWRPCWRPAVRGQGPAGRGSLRRFPGRVLPASSAFWGVLVSLGLYSRPPLTHISPLRAFRLLRSTRSGNTKWKISEAKHFRGFRLRAALRGVVKSRDEVSRVPLRPSLGRDAALRRASCVGRLRAVCSRPLVVRRSVAA